jgi:hypothetical protein
MSDTIRKRGLEAEAAVERWSDPAAHSEFAEVSGVRQRHTDEPHSIARLRRYSQLRNGLIEAFMLKLQNGDLLASGIPRFGERREVIHPSLWDDLAIIFPSSEISRRGVIYRKVEFFEPTDIPANVFPLPEWLTETSARYFYPEGLDFRHVRVEGETIVLGDQQRKVIAFLHKKMLENEPWQALRSIQDGAQVNAKMQDLFGRELHWSKLLLSDRKGSYRLRDRPDMTLAEDVP